ncbi:MAG: ABC transporter ATP-binding protein [Deltaproteobacteria bacterium]|nr:ABC transporter ATP-binding protein [Deltaproteobacteria bacterium]
MDEMSFVLIKEVTKRFGTVTAVDNVSLAVEKGEVFGLVGSDGAGKSTLLRMAATMIPPDSGSISIKGLNVIHDRQKVKMIMGYMPQRFGLYQDLTVNENMQFFMDIFGIFGDERKRRLERYLGFSNLLPFLDRPAGKLSGGMKQKLGLACVLVHEPELLILDEPTNGVDPVSRMEFWDILFSMKRQGMTILVSTSYLDEGEKCDKIALMHKARILNVDNPDNLKQGFPDLEEAVIERIRDIEIPK